jgi:HD-GYP domain-containing protein (c-di-GMP phosphodiesterase class II)
MWAETTTNRGWRRGRQAGKMHDMFRRRNPGGESARPAVDVGSRELLSMLCEALAQELGASDCLVSRWDRPRGVTVGVAGFTGTTERWTLFAGEYPLDRYPVTLRVLTSGDTYTTCVDDPGGDAAEQELLRAHGLTAGLLLRLDAPVPYLVEVWSDCRPGAFTRRERRRASGLVRVASGLLPAALERDREREDQFERAAEDARSIGAADQRLSEMATAVGEAMRLDEPALDELRLVALVHDAGRRSIPSALLEKPGVLTPVEWAVVQRHTLVGQRMIARMPYLADAVAGVGAIRERWDGSGYPAALEGAKIPLSARIVAVCAAYMAMREGRRGRPPLAHADVIDRLHEAAGSQFDPDVVRAMISAIEPDGPRPTVRLRVAAI